MKKFLWIGVCANQEIKDNVIKNGGKILSATVSQDNILEGFENNGVIPDSINAFRVGEYPRYKELLVKGYRWNRKAETEDVNVSYLNLKFVSHLFKEKALVKEAKKWAKKNKDNEIVVFVYSMHSPFMAAAKAVKKIVPSAKIALIVLDLPQFMDLGMNKVKAFLKEIDWKKIQKLMKSVDKYILYSRHMAEFLKLKETSWTVMEGSVNENDIVEDDSSKKNDVISIMYSGVCDMRYGVPELLDAFDLIKDDNYELWITGGGNAEALIKERAEKDKRIKYYGFLPSRKELLQKQKQAHMMVNMRKPDEAASAYCFPSKIFEYMLSGNPVLSFDIPGIPSEYFDYLVKMEDISPETVAKTIKNVADMTEEERLALGKSSRRFVIENKNKTIQAKKILEFVENE